MTFVRGPEEAVFQDDQPAKLRFFMGYADEFSREYGAEQVSLDPLEIHRDQWCLKCDGSIFRARTMTQCLRDHGYIKGASSQNGNPMDRFIGSTQL